MLSFSLNLIDDNNNQIEFENKEKKSKYFKFQNWCYFIIIRNRRATKSSYQIKEEQINFLLEDIKKNLEEYKKAIELRDKKTYRNKRNTSNRKKSYDLIVRENQQLKEYILNIKKIYIY